MRGKSIMVKKKFILSIFVGIFSVFLWYVCAFFCVSNVGLYAVEGEGTGSEAGTEISEYNILYLDSDVEHTPLDTPNPIKITRADLPLVIYAPTNTKAGYEFSYWGFNREYPLDTDAADRFILTTDDLANANGDTITLYAYWNVMQYSISVSYGGVTYGQVYDVTGFKNVDYKITVNDNFDLTSKDFIPRCSGHEFLGWYTDSTCSTEVTRLSGITSDVSIFGLFQKVDLYIMFADESLGLDPITFRAGIDRAYDYNGQEGLLTDIVPVREGYIFDGWYTDEDFDATHKVGAFYIFSSSENVVLYAKWIAKPSPVWWYLFGGLGGVTIIGFLIWWLQIRKTRLN